MPPGRALCDRVGLRNHRCTPRTTALQYPMPIVRPRLTDYREVLLAQAHADFAIPFLDEDIPLYLDPFLLWRSPSQQDNVLHTALINSFNHLGYLEKQGHHAQA